MTAMVSMPVATDRGIPRGQTRRIRLLGGERGGGDRNGQQQQ